jgi:hypothetical protein
MTGVQTQQGSFLGNVTSIATTFKPYAILFWAVGNPGTTNNSWTNSIEATYGFYADDAASHTYNANVGSSSLYATTGNEACYLWEDSTNCFNLYSTAGAELCAGHVSATTTTSFTISYATSSASYTIFYLAIGGDVSAACITPMTFGAAASPQTFNLPNSLSWTPSAVLFASDTWSSEGPFSGYVGLFMGALDASGHQWAATLNSANEPSAATVDGRIFSTSYCLAGCSTANGAINATAVGAVSAGGFKLTEAGTGWSTVFNGGLAYALCLYCGTANEIIVGNWAKNITTSSCPTSCTDSVTVTNMGTVQGAFFSHTSDTISEGTTMGRLTLGASDGTNNGCIAVTDKNAVASGSGATCASIMETGKCLLVTTNDAKTTEATATATFSTNVMSIPWNPNGTKSNLASNATSTKLPLTSASGFTAGGSIYVAGSTYNETAIITSIATNTLTVPTLTNYTHYTTANSAYATEPPATLIGYVAFGSAAVNATVTLTAEPAATAALQAVVPKISYTPSQVAATAAQQAAAGNVTLNQPAASQVAATAALQAAAGNVTLNQPVASQVAATAAVQAAQVNVTLEQLIVSQVAATAAIQAVTISTSQSVTATQVAATAALQAAAISTAISVTATQVAATAASSSTTTEVDFSATLDLISVTANDTDTTTQVTTESDFASSLSSLTINSNTGTTAIEEDYAATIGTLAATANYGTVTAEADYAATPSVLSGSAGISTVVVEGDYSGAADIILATAASITTSIESDCSTTLNSLSETATAITTGIAGDYSVTHGSLSCASNSPAANVVVSTEEVDVSIDLSSLVTATNSITTTLETDYSETYPTLVINLSAGTITVEGDYTTTVSSLSNASAITVISITEVDQTLALSSLWATANLTIVLLEVDEGALLSSLIISSNVGAVGITRVDQNLGLFSNNTSAASIAVSIEGDYAATFSSLSETAATTIVGITQIDQNLTFASLNETTNTTNSFYINIGGNIDLTVTTLTASANITGISISADQNLPALTPLVTTADTEAALLVGDYSAAISSLSEIANTAALTVVSTYTTTLLSLSQIAGIVAVTTEEDVTIPLTTLTGVVDVGTLTLGNSYSAMLASLSEAADTTTTSIRIDQTLALGVIGNAANVVTISVVEGYAVVLSSIEVGVNNGTLSVTQCDQNLPVLTLSETSHCTTLNIESDCVETLDVSGASVSPITLAIESDYTKLFTSLSEAINSGTLGVTRADQNLTAFATLLAAVHAITASVVSTTSYMFNTLTESANVSAPSYELSYLIIGAAVGVLMGIIGLVVDCATTLVVFEIDANSGVMRVKAVNWWGCRQEEGVVKGAFVISGGIISKELEEEGVKCTFTFAPEAATDELEADERVISALECKGNVLSTRTFSLREL